MAGSFSKAALGRRMRNLGNVNKIPSKHPDGNKGGFANNGPMGRASSGQMASASMHNPFQKGAPPATGQKPSPPVKNPAASKPTPNSGIAQDMKDNKARLRSPQGPYGLPAIQRRLGF